MRDLYVVTHTEATHVLENLVGGWYDSELTPRGAEQARRIAEALAHQVPTGSAELLCSDLLRTRQTAEPIAGLLGVEPIFDAASRERATVKGRASPLAPSDSCRHPPMAIACAITMA